MSNENNKKNIPATEKAKSPKPLTFYFMVVIMVVGLVATVFLSIAHIGATYPDFPWGDIAVICVGISFLALFWICAFNRGYKKGHNDFTQRKDGE